MSIPGHENVTTMVGRNLRSLREHQGFTLAALAERSGVAKATLSNLETGRGNPTLETLFALSRGLGVPLSDLIASPEAIWPSLVRGDSVPVMSGEAVSLRFFGRFGAGPSVSEVYDMRVRLGNTQRSVGHPGVECILVTRGVLRTGPVDSPVELSTGDYVSFSAESQHFYEAVGGPVESVLIIHYPGRLAGAAAMRDGGPLLDACEH